MIEAAPFPVRPDSVRPADLLGPYDGIVLDADSDRPIAGATVAASWAFERGIGLHAPAGAHEVVTETGADGRYTIPSSTICRSGASTRVRRFTLIVYHRGHVAWRSDRLFPAGRRAATSASAATACGSRTGSRACATPSTWCSWAAAQVRTAAAWELQAAALELEGEQRRRCPAARRRSAGRAAVATTAGRSTSRSCSSDDEIRGVTGYVGKFEDGKLTDLPTTEFYDSRHFKAVGKPESFDVGLRVWRLGTGRGRGPVPQADEHAARAQATDEVGDASFRAKSGGIAALVFLVRERGVVVSMTCGGGAVPRAGQLVKLAKLVESHLPELPPEPPRGRARRRARAGGDAVKPTRVTVRWRRVAVLPRWRPGRAAYDPATTHAGLTERAVLASELHRVLARALSRPLGLFEPSRCRSTELPTRPGARSEARLAALDPAGGYRRRARTASRRRWPGSSPARSSPRRRPSAARTSSSTRAAAAGLSQAGGLASLGNTLRLAARRGGGFRALAHRHARST